MRSPRAATLTLLLLVLTVPWSACKSRTGGGDGGGSIAGVAFKGPVRDGVIRAFAFLNDGSRGALLSESLTDADGHFVLALPRYTGPVWLELSSGTYTDEATGIDTEIPSSRPLTCLVPHHAAGTALADVSVTPLTSIAGALASAWATAGVAPADAAAQANESIGAHFGVADITGTPPADLSAPLGATAPTNAGNAALLIAGIAQMAADLGATATDLVAALAEDVADGAFDGLGPFGQLTLGGTDLATDTTTAHLAEAIRAFLNSAANGSGITVDQATWIIDHVDATGKKLELPPTKRPPVTGASPAGGVFTAPLSVTLTAVDADDAQPTIYYTLDGTTTPTLAHHDGQGGSPLSGIAIDQPGTTVLRFIAQDANGNVETEVKEEIYVVNLASALPPIVVNSLADPASLPPGTATITLRSALASAASGQPIVFDPSLDGGTIDLSHVGETHTLLKGEVMGMRNEPSGPVSYLVGYFDRDYGRSALYARKDVVIDASALPNGITFSWGGGESNPARVLAVYGDLTMTNASVTGGWSVFATSTVASQPWTLARGAGVAVWGVARLVGCEIYDNHCRGDFDSSRDRGAFGGGLYADIVDLERCVVSGNTVLGGGAAGGGVFSVTGATAPQNVSTIRRSSITGNRISALFTYGGGVFSDGGGIGNRKTLRLINCTVARNVVEPPPGMPPFLLGIGYWRGGGIYISNGYLTVQSCTVAQNEVHGVPRTDDLGKPNLAGGIAATIGNAHAVEDMTIGHSLIVGNTVHEVSGSPISYGQDIFTGSLLHFRSMGHNRIGVVDFSQILVPVGQRDWASLCRKHYPKTGDENGVVVTDVLDLATGVTRSNRILSEGVDQGSFTVLHYAPRGSALVQVPTSTYSVSETYAEYRIGYGATDDFQSIVLSRLESHYGLTGFADRFKTDFEAYLQGVDLDDATQGLQPYTDPSGLPILALPDARWFGPSRTWPKELSNYPYIIFWHRLDAALLAESIPGMGPELLGDDAWTALFSSGQLSENPKILLEVKTDARLQVPVQPVDQLGTLRPTQALRDIGAIEVP